MKANFKVIKEMDGEELPNTKASLKMEILMVGVALSIKILFMKGILLLETIMELVFELVQSMMGSRKSREYKNK